MGLINGVTPFLIFFFLVNTFGITPLAQAQEFFLPAPGVRVLLSPKFFPPILKGIKVNPDNPLHFDFILDVGARHAVPLQEKFIREESTRLIKYFLASLTIPEKDLWVNLSPYEKNRIIPQSFGLTEMGRDLLAEDYMLKQITASLIYPEDDIGKKFWKRIYEEAETEFGTTNIPVNTFNKVWIVPEKVVVYENVKAGTAYIVESKLKVMLEEDYLSLQEHDCGGGPCVRPIQWADTRSAPTSKINALGSQIIREIVIPELTKEVNENKNFTQLRQVYNSLILASWYKKKIKDSILNSVYSDRDKISGVAIEDPQEKEKIYQRYLKAFKIGVYNYIKEEQDPMTQEIAPRKYFSGGEEFDHLDRAMTMIEKVNTVELASHDLVEVKTDFGVYSSNDKAMDAEGRVRDIDEYRLRGLIRAGDVSIDEPIDRVEEDYGFSRIIITKVFHEEKNKSVPKQSLTKTAKIVPEQKLDKQVDLFRPRPTGTRDRLRMDFVIWLSNQRYSEDILMLAKRKFPGVSQSYMTMKIKQQFGDRYKGRVKKSKELKSKRIKPTREDKDGFDQWVKDLRRQEPSGKKIYAADIEAVTKKFPSLSASYISSRINRHNVLLTSWESIKYLAGGSVVFIDAQDIIKIRDWDILKKKGIEIRVDSKSSQTFEGPGVGDKDEPRLNYKERRAQVSWQRRKKISEKINDFRQWASGKDYDALRKIPLDRLAMDFGISKAVITVIISNRKTTTPHKDSQNDVVGLRSFISPLQGKTVYNLMVEDMIEMFKVSQTTVNSQKAHRMTLIKKPLIITWEKLLALPEDSVVFVDDKQYSEVKDEQVLNAKKIYIRKKPWLDSAMRTIAMEENFRIRRLVDHLAPSEASQLEDIQADLDEVLKSNTLNHGLEIDDFETIQKLFNTIRLVAASNGALSTMLMDYMAGFIDQGVFGISAVKMAITEGDILFLGKMKLSDGMFRKPKDRLWSVLQKKGIISDSLLKKMMEEKLQGINQLIKQPSPNLKNLKIPSLKDISIRIRQVIYFKSVFPELIIDDQGMIKDWYGFTVLVFARRSNRSNTQNIDFRELNNSSKVFNPEQPGVMMVQFAELLNAGIFNPLEVIGEMPEGYWNFLTKRKFNERMAGANLNLEAPAAQLYEALNQTLLNRAMVSGNLNGGIDLTSMNAFRDDSKGIKFHLDPAMLKQLQEASGFVPVRTIILPMADLKAFLGVSNS